MRRLLYSFATALSCALLLGACVKDKGNYDYIDADAPKFDFDSANSFTVQSGEDLEIDPKVQHSNTANPDEYAYEWFIQPNSQQYNLLPNQTGPTLKFTDIQSGGTYRLRVTNVRTGAKYLFSRSYTVNLVNTRGRGYVYLVQNGADVDLEMMAEPVGGRTEFYGHFKNMISEQEGTEIGYKDRTGLDIVAINNANDVDPIPNLKAATFFLLTDKSCDMLSNSSYSYIADFKTGFANYSNYTQDGGAPTKYLVSNAAAGGVNIRPAMYWNGNWFWANYTTSTPQPFADAVNIPQTTLAYTAPRGKELTVSDKAVNISGAGMLVMWSEERHQFLIKTGAGFALVSSTNAMGRLTSLWLVDDNAVAEESMKVGGDANFKVQVADRELIHLGVRGNVGDRNFFAVVNDPTGDGYQVLTFNAGTAGTSVTKSAVYKFPAGSNIENAKFFASTGAYLYYATEDKLYAFLYNEVIQPAFDVATLATMTEGEGGSAHDVPATLIPAGEKIALLKIFQNEYGANTDRLRQLQIITKNAAGQSTHTVWTPNNTDAGLKMARYDALPFDPETHTQIQVPDPTEQNPERTKNKIVPTNMRFTGLGDVVALTLDDR